MSITHDFVKLLLLEKGNTIKIYSNTFCADEIYKQTICWNSEFKEKIYNITNEGEGCMRMIGWADGELKDWEERDFEKLIQSNKMFARKFNSNQKKVVHNILKYINPNG